MDGLRFAARGHRFHAFDLLEAQIISDKPPLPWRFHSSGGLLGFRHCVFLQIDRCPGSPCAYGWHLLGVDIVRLPDQIRFHLMDAIPIRWALGAHPFRFRSDVVPTQ